MANWRRRRQGGEFHDQEAYRVRSDYRGPSQSQSQAAEIQKAAGASVPRWEKKFCSVVGGMPWKRFVENKRYVHLSKNVLDWDDSAGEEAFHNAKRRFWSELHHVPCRGLPSPPNPDSTAGPVDWDAPADPALYSDLDLETQRRRNPVQLAADEDFVGPGLTEALLSAPPAISCTGWGDLDDNVLAAGGGDDDPRAEKGFESRADRGFRGRRRGNHQHQKHPLRQWNIKSCPQQVS